MKVAFKCIIRNTGGARRWSTIKRNYSPTSNVPPPQMPAFNYTPSQYEGPDYDTLQEIKQNHVVQCIRQYYKKPLLVHEGRMQWLFDQNGKRYLDMFGGIVTVSVGHCHPQCPKDQGNKLVLQQLLKSVIRIKPPMCVTKEDGDFTVAVLRRAFQHHSHRMTLPS